MVQRKEGQLRYGKLLLSDGSVADYPTAFILVENREAHRSDQRGPSTWIIARPWLEEDSEEGILAPVVVPGAAEKVGVEEELAFEQVDLAGILDRMHKLPDSVTFAFTMRRNPTRTTSRPCAPTFRRKCAIRSARLQERAALRFLGPLQGCPPSSR